MTTRSNRLFLLAAASFTFLGVAFVLHGSNAQVSPKTIQPVTITYQEVQYRPDSRMPGLAFTTMLGVRSDGSFSRARYHQPTPDQAAYFTLQITDVPRAQHIVVDPFTKSLSTVAYDSSQLASVRIHPADSCPGAPGEPMAGYPTTIVEKQIDIATIHLVTKKWRSAKLDCLVLREESQVKWRTGKTSLKVLTATLVTPGAPADWMFQVPAGYTERSPNQILAEAVRKKGLHPLPWDPQLDENYYSGRGSQTDKSLKPNK